MNIKRHYQGGLTLVELMIAIVLGMLVTAAVAYIFINSSSSARFDNQAASIQEGGRFSMHFLADDLRMANFWGYELTPKNIQMPASPFNPEVCGIEPFRWVADAASPEGGIELVAADTWLSGTCLATETNLRPKAGTQMLVIKRVSGTPAGEPDTTVPASVFISGKPFLLVGGKDSKMLVGTGGTLPLGSDELLWEYMTRIYYVSADDQLCRKVLASSTTFTTECVLEGVEEFRVAFMLDDPGDDDTLPDRQTDAALANASPSQLPFYSSTVNPYNFAVGARVCVLATSKQDIRGFTNDKTYSVCGYDPFGGTPPNDSRLRRVFEKSVSLRNSAALQIYN